MVVDYVQRDPSLVRLMPGAALRQLPGIGDPAAPAAPAASEHETLDPPAFGSDCGGCGFGAGSQCGDRARELSLGFGGQG